MIRKLQSSTQQSLMHWDAKRGEYQAVQSSFVKRPQQSRNAYNEMGKGDDWWHSLLMRVLGCTFN